MLWRKTRYNADILKCFVSFLQGKCEKPARAQSLPLLGIELRVHISPCSCRGPSLPHPTTPLPPPAPPPVSPRAGGMLSRTPRGFGPPENPQKKQREQTTRSVTTRQHVVPTLSFSGAGEASARPEAIRTGLFQAKSCTLSQVCFSFWFIVISQHAAKSLCVARCVCLYISALALQS